MSEECSFLTDLCLSTIDSTSWGIILEVFLLLYGFLGLAAICDDYLVASLEVLCIRWRVREDIAGATFMAFGSAAPEIVVNAVTTLKGQSDTGVGAIIGSGWIAFLLIPGVCALCTDGPLEIKRRPMLRDMMFYAIALAELSIFFHDGKVVAWEAVSLVGTYIAYLMVVWIAPILRRKWRERQGEIVVDSKSFVELVEEEKSFLEMMDVRADNETSVQVFVSEVLDDVRPDNSFCGCIGSCLEFAATPLLYLFKITVPPCKRGTSYECLYPLTFLMSIVWVAVFSTMVSSVVERWADMSGLNSGFFGLFPHQRRYGSMAVANSIGSQIINICIGLGMPWAMHNAVGAPVMIDDHASLQIAVLFQAGVVTYSFILFLASALVLRLNKAVLNRRKGYLLAGMYFIVLGAYAATLFTTQPPP